MGQSPVAGGRVGKQGKQGLGRRRNKTDLCHYLGFHPLMEVALHRLSITPPKSTFKMSTTMVNANGQPTNINETSPTNL